MRLEPWLLLALAGCTERHVDAAGSDTSVSEPTVQPTLALPARAVSVTESSPPYEGPERTLGDFVLDLLDCVKPGECPRSDEGKARRKAERTFNCSPALVDAALRRDAVVDDSALNEERFSLPPSEQTYFISTGGSLRTASAFESLFVQKETASVFQVVGCEQWGVVVCATGNRTVRTPDTTYENTADRVCLWGRIEPPSRSR
jgi:hypothetical protein